MEQQTLNIISNIEDKEEIEDEMTKPKPVPEKSILKAKPKKPRSQVQQVAFARCQAARRLKLASKPDTGSRVKNMHVETPVQKAVKNRRKNTSSYQRFE